MTNKTIIVSPPPFSTWPSIKSIALIPSNPSRAASASPPWIRYHRLPNCVRIFARRGNFKFLLMLALKYFIAGVLFWALWNISSKRINFDIFWCRLLKLITQFKRIQFLTFFPESIGSYEYVSIKRSSISHLNFSFLWIFNQGFEQNNLSFVFALMQENMVSDVVNPHNVLKKQQITLEF